LPQTHKEIRTASDASIARMLSTNIAPAVSIFTSMVFFLKRNGYKPDQVQDSIPAPYDIATCMLWPLRNPGTISGKKWGSYLLPLGQAGDGRQPSILMPSRTSSTKIAQPTIAVWTAGTTKSPRPCDQGLWNCGNFTPRQAATCGSDSAWFAAGAAPSHPPAPAALPRVDAPRTGWAGRPGGMRRSCSGFETCSSGNRGAVGRRAGGWRRRGPAAWFR
jgi:hypothetical protein